ncbi:hypothetical protein PR048_009321, partial [Dryococelus australis]
MEDKTSKPVIKRKALSVFEKLDISNYVSSNPNLARVTITKQLQLPVSTLQYCGQTRPVSSAFCSSTTSPKEKRALNIPIHGTVIRQKAEEIVFRLNIQFTASHGFRKRAGIVYKTVCRESASVREETVGAWKIITLPPLLAEYKAQDVFNADECGLFINLLPDSTFAFKGDKWHGNKKKNERVTVFFCTTVDGYEKLPVLVKGKSQKRRCLKNVKSLPCVYKSNMSSWMTCKVFSEFLFGTVPEELPVVSLDTVEENDNLLPFEVQESENLCKSSKNSSMEQLGQPCDANENDSEHDEEDNAPKQVTFSEAMQYFEAYFRYLSSVPDVPENMMKNLWEFESYTA